MQVGAYGSVIMRRLVGRGGSGNPAQRLKKWLPERAVTGKATYSHRQAIR